MQTGLLLQKYSTKESLVFFLNRNILLFKGKEIKGEGLNYLLASSSFPSRASSSVDTVLLSKMTFPLLILDSNADISISLILSLLVNWRDDVGKWYILITCDPYYRTNNSTKVHVSFTTC